MIGFVFGVVLLTVVFAYAAVFLRGYSAVLDIFLLICPLLISLGTLIYVVLNS